jgi:2-polyprenyl-3-methyl-5-hydroxy-6-metoxy-1,4-benzoquinol methylase
MNCRACGSLNFKSKYQDVRDLLFGSPGVYQYLECCNCGTLRLMAPNGLSLQERYPPAYSRRKVPVKPPGTFRKAIRMYRDLVNSIGRRASVGKRSSKISGVLSAVWNVLDVDGTMRVGLPTSGRKSLLDVGCGDGSYLLKMHRLGWQVHGVETSEDSVAICQSLGLAVTYGNIEHAVLPRPFFDVIVLKHVLEHVEEPRSFLIVLRNLLSETGRIYITTPNAGSYNSLRFGENWLGLDVSRHEQVFTRAGLERLAMEAGLSVDKLDLSHRIDRFVAFAGYMRESGKNPYLESSLPLVLLSYVSLFKNVLTKTAGDEIYIVLKKGAA